MMIKEDLQLLKQATTRKVLRSFGLSIGGVLLAIAAFLFWKESSAAVYFTVPGALLVVFGLLLPNALKQLYWGWMTVALAIGFVMTRVIFTIVYMLVFTPTSLIAKLLGKDLLEAGIDKEAKTYWKKREQAEYDPASTENQY